MIEPRPRMHRPVVDPPRAGAKNPLRNHAKKRGARSRLMNRTAPSPAPTGTGSGSTIATGSRAATLIS